MQGAEEGTGSGNHESSEILGPRKRASNIFKPSTTFGEWVTRLVSQVFAIRVEESFIYH